MKKLLSLIAILAIPAVVFAQTDSARFTQNHFDALDTNKDNKISLTEYQDYMDKSFHNLDKNNNGYLTRDEFAGLITDEQFAKLDVNKNGKVTKEVFMEKVTAEFKKQDRNDDGYLTNQIK